MADNRHPGISMHKLPVGPGFVGLVFTVGCMLIFLLALPELWYFLAGGIALGVGLALVFRATNERRSLRSRPLSISMINENTEKVEASRRENRFQSPALSLS